MSEGTLVALTPADVAPAQQAIVGWCRQKMITLGKEYTDHLQNIAIAKKYHWKRSNLVAAARRTKQRIQYYQKIGRASALGYLIIPNLPVEVIAVRVDRTSPKWASGHYPTAVNTAQPQQLAAGEGRYVDETLPHQRETWTEQNPKGGGAPVEKSRVVVGGDLGYTEEMDFPITLVKPVVLEATAEALRHRIFDRVGIMRGGAATTVASGRQRRSDPLVVGQIIDPTSPRYSRRVVSFFVAWWLDPEAL